jgi:hypothetical protein
VLLRGLRKPSLINDSSYSCKCSERCVPPSVVGFGDKFGASSLMWARCAWAPRDPGSIHQPYLPQPAADQYLPPHPGLTLILCRVPGAPCLLGFSPKTLAFPQPGWGSQKGQLRAQACQGTDPHRPLPAPGLAPTHDLPLIETPMAAGPPALSHLWGMPAPVSGLCFLLLGVSCVSEGGLPVPKGKPVTVSTYA